MEEAEARFSLLAGEGDGTILGMAAGDTAGGAWELGYSAITEQATVISYQLIEHERLNRDQVVAAIRELDGVEEDEPVYRAESPHFRSWLDRAAAGSPVPEREPSIDPLARSAPIGVAFRRDPDRLLAEVIGLETIFHSEARTILGGIAFASAVAASCFAQSGRDLVAGVAEALTPAVAILEQRSDLVGTDLLSGSAAEVRALVDLVGIGRGEEALAAAGGSGPDPWSLAKAGLLIAAPVVDRSHLPLEQAARIGGSGLGAAVGAVIGARVGIRAWPWAFANDTWFAEIGRRLVRGPREVRDLPIPYAVEQHLISGERRGFH